jgi:carbamoyltransferase
MSLILGLNMGHDGSAALVGDGRLVGALSRERLSRKKKHTGVSLDLVEYVLSMANARLEDIDAVAFAVYRYHPDNEVKVFTEDGAKEITHDLFDVPFRRLSLPYRVQLGPGCTRPAYFVHHHLSHCASAFYTSPFDQGACFSLDASMVRPEACSLFAYGEGTKLFPFYCPGLMIGNAYSIFTRKLGLGRGLFKAGTTMGLAAYGEPGPRARERAAFYAQSFYSRHWMRDDLTFIDYMWSDLSGKPPRASFSESVKDSREAMQIAASLQFVFEEAIVDYANRLFEETRAFNGDNVCLSGGSFLNCNANTAVKTRTPFRRVHLFPAASDDGTAAGAALWVAHHVQDLPRVSYAPGQTAYLGKAYPTPAAAAGEPLDVRFVAEALARGQIVAWYQGGGEFGPRALGHRSILADARGAGMRDVINFEVKRREWFRPLAPAVLAEHAKDWFDFEGNSPFMLHTCRVRRPLEIPAVTHVDGTARHQTVTRSDVPALHGLLQAFYSLTQVPVLLNTSLNVSGEPLCETPDDALRFFQSGLADVLVINDHMLRREPGAARQDASAATSIADRQLSPQLE